MEQIFDIIKELHRAGTTILLVEQNAQMALSVADRGYVLETGRVTLTGPGRELLADEAVKRHTWAVKRQPGGARSAGLFSISPLTGVL